MLAAVDGMTAVLVEAGQSICLTDAGRRLVESHRQ